MMGPRKFIAETAGQLRRDGAEGLADVAYDLYTGFLWSKVSRRVGGRHVFEHDWDLLIVLDACRYDLFETVAPDYEFAGDVVPVRSVGSTSREWLQKTFAPDHHAAAANTTYVTANPFSDSTLDGTDLGGLEEVWRDDWDEGLGTVPADPVTDRAITRWRAGDADRMIVHYMQPHFPSVPEPSFGSGIELDAVGDHWDSVWHRLRKGDISVDAVRRAYRANLEYALDSVGTLLSSVDADRVVLTADHGNAFGSWGVYGHPPAAIPAVRTVPWCETTARDRGEYDPSPAKADRDLDDDVASKLHDLGYV
jgi:hypothetical protein